MEYTVNGISINRFREHIKSFVGQVIREHSPLKLTRKSGDEFVMLSDDDRYLKPIHGHKDKTMHTALCHILKEMLRGDPSKDKGIPEQLKHKLTIL